MDGPALSGWEERALTEIERDLSADARLNRELRTMRPAGLHRVGPALAAIARLPLAAMVLLAALSAGLVAVGVWIRSPDVVVTFAAIGVPASALLLLRVGRGRAVRRRATGERRPPR